MLEWSDFVWMIGGDDGGTRTCNQKHWFFFMSFIYTELIHSMIKIAFEITFNKWYEVLESILLRLWLRPYRFYFGHAISILSIYLPYISPFFSLCLSLSYSWLCHCVRFALSVSCSPKWNELWFRTSTKYSVIV